MDTFKRIGFSVGDTVKLLWLHRSSETKVNPKELHDIYVNLFPGRDVAYDYVARIAKKLEHDGYLQLIQVQHKKYYSITTAGKEYLQRYEELYYNKFVEILKVIDRIYYYLTKDGQKPVSPEYPLQQEFRTYFSKLISVKDMTRFMIFNLGSNRTEFYAAEVNEQLNELFGWSPSNGYLYEITREMEAEGTISGRWKEPEKRTVRLIQVTDEGEVFAKQIASNLREQVINIRKYLRSFVDFLIK
ncbi:helix-turn-helix transcriptional regulator [Lysinibacillus fusiformis]|uniref:helix-turn-helix transcriptional regulator n=1 Tax=Lysinibacillus fusiformis TaxID=28031 RepID=UPI00087F165B|nr:helix-turn-helix transcriptional regulator [Lysinibacillus fusiformis]SCX63350.1 DNA-binding transcriptional regulator, PadR family [Lysinibacillus fusiformis]SDB46130.1 DNA-binding transcriptional regulator, PadR family [Lysinibacillus fusiformis]SFI72457.1 DNA-binding transcriptional regulator, PadR family [Lysinibacillus fusiformis]SFT15468.1 DNA-binding transcriptional regulator, PadR family [Lysinibacillus fusiformis]